MAPSFLRLRPRPLCVIFLVHPQVDAKAYSTGPMCENTREKFHKNCNLLICNATVPAAVSTNVWEDLTASVRAPDEMIKLI